MIALVVFTDGRDHVYATIPSALDHLHGPISTKIIYDDSGDQANRARLVTAFPEFAVLSHAEGRQGFGGAIRHVWQYLVRRCSDEFIFHLEDDFLFRQYVDLAGMAAVLRERPALAQLALRRQPWNAEERAAGGIVELDPAAYVDCFDGEHDWLEHRKFFTTNPSLYRRTLCAQTWPEDPHSEGKFGIDLRQRSELTRFGYWGTRNSGEWVEHIGLERVGTGY